MVRIRYNDAQLLGKYAAAAVAYARYWQHIDVMMRGVVKVNSAVGCVPVHTKVVLIDSIYRSQLSRSVGSKAHRAVAEALAQVPGVHTAIDKLATARRLNTKTMPKVLAAHNEIMSAANAAIPSDSQVSDLRSFASKYLHFHAEVAPIYDSITSGVISRFTDRRDMRTRVSAYETAISDIVRVDPSYRWYIVRFLALMEHLASLGTTATVKEIDHMLWIEVA